MNTLHLDKIPDELKAKDQWVLWRYEGRNGRPTKIPCQANGWPAKTDDATTWAAFERARDAFLQSLGRFDGIGYVFSEDDPFVGIDLDRSVATDGSNKPWAIQYVDMLGSTYSEISPSGRGIKIWTRGSLSGSGLSVKGGFDPNDREAGIEIYDRGRYFAVTGNALGDSQIEDHQAAVDAIEKDLQARKAAKRAAKGGPTTKGPKRPPTFVKSAGRALPSGRKVVAKLGVAETMTVSGRTYDTADVVDRALTYLNELDPSIQGQNGSARMLWACRVVQVGFALRGKLARAVIGWFYRHKCNPLRLAERGVTALFDLVGQFVANPLGIAFMFVKPPNQPLGQFAA
jgi:putative DNA primase/helicase